MRLHHKGYVPLLVTLAILLALVCLINLAFPHQTFIHYILYGIGVVFYFLCIRFFRRPLREILADSDNILSAADGHVVVIEEIHENQYLPGPADTGISFYVTIKCACELVSYQRGDPAYKIPPGFPYSCLQAESQHGE